ncbi:MAG: fumarylacetoacetate hydrolase family protein [Chloroflexota bacterium]
MAAIARCDELHKIAANIKDAAADGTVDEVTLGVCIPHPSKVFGIGLNYRAHAAEAGLDIPDAPMVFTKFPSCLAGPTADIELRSDRVDWEVELVVVIGKEGQDISEERAWDYVAGLTVGQDLSDRRVQFAVKPPQFSLGKSFNTYGPIGPAVVSPDLLPDKENLAITCEVAGEMKQDSRTNDLIFSIPQLIAYLSSITPLVPGDLIFTGTPAGVGGPVGRYLADGETIVSTIEGIGTIRNTCVKRY